MVEAIEDIKDDWTNAQMDINEKLNKKGIENKIIFEPSKFSEFDIVDMRINKQTCRLCLKNKECPIHGYKRSLQIKYKDHKVYEAVQKNKREEYALPQKC